MELEYHEIIEINGGVKSDYNLGHAVGDHLRQGVKTAGDVIKWFSDVLRG